MLHRRGACFFGGGARYDLAAPPFLSVSGLYTDFASTVSPWQRQRHGFEGGGILDPTFCIHGETVFMILIMTSKRLPAGIT